MPLETLVIDPSVLTSDVPVLLADVSGDVLVLVGTGVAAVFAGQMAIINRLMTKYFELSETRNREAQLQIEKAQVVDANDMLQKQLDKRVQEISRLEIQLDEARRVSRNGT